MLKKIKAVLKSNDETDRILANPAMVKRLNESKKQIAAGKGIKVKLDKIIVVAR